MEKEIIKRFTSKGVFPHQMAFTLLIPFRNIFLSPKKLVKRLELENNFNVLEVGSGPGYYSVYVAKNLTDGNLVIADIQPEMLNYAKKRIDKKRIHNVEYYLCNGISFDFKDNYFDRIFLVAVVGEVENKSEYFNEFFRMLKKGGILSISELGGDPDKLTAEEIKRLAETAGFEFYKLYGNKFNFTINFKKNVHG
ncbi:MAG: methyltransferase domain-containing protein [Melioribacteraceae bacterium]